jgi:hypothetical protein
VLLQFEEAIYPFAGAPVRVTAGPTARGQWRTAKKKTYPPALCQVLADSIMDAVNHMRVTCAEHDWPEDMREEEEELRGSLAAFYVSWDPYVGTDESWAPDFVSMRARRTRADPERHRFLPPEPQSSTQPMPGVVFDPEAEARPPGPIEASEEQEYADALAFLDGTIPPQPGDSEPLHEPTASSLPPPLPPQPVELTDALRARIAANRAQARERRRQRLAQRIAPWTFQPGFGTGILDMPQV